MLQGGYQSVLETRTRDEFRGAVHRFAKHLEFETFSAVTVIDRTIGQSDFIAVDNTPAGWSDAFNDLTFARSDPVLQHCKRNSVPIVWDRKTYVHAGMGDRWEAQSQYGYHTGICLAVHLPEGRHFVMGFDRDKPLPSDSIHVTRLVADMQLFAVYAMDTAMRVLLPPEQQIENPKLTPRELECLHWTMEGKTAWEVGAILSITERTAVLHLNNAMHKLGSTSKHQAVLKALRLGLIR